MPEAKLSYLNVNDIPCRQLQTGTEQSDKIATQLEKKRMSHNTVEGICPKCGIKFFRSEIPQIGDSPGGVLYIPGRGWPERCVELYPKPKRPTRRRW